MKNINSMVKQMESDLTKLGYSDLKINANCEQALSIVVATMCTIQTYVSVNKFIDEAEEILFFKKVMPAIGAKVALIHFMIEYKAASYISKEACVEIVNKCQLKFKKTFMENKNYFFRMTRGFVEDDKEFFIRGNFNAPLNCLGKDSLRNIRFTTFHSLLKEHLIAQELIQNFVKANQTNESNESNETYNFESLPWERSKTDFVEFVYAIYFLLYNNNPNITLKKLADQMKVIFAVEIKDFYRTYTDIKMRANPTQLIDEMKGRLLEYINDEDKYQPE